jgi:hypothetical protein
MSATSEPDGWHFAQMPELVLPRLDRPRGVSDDMKRTLPNDQTFTLGRCRPERSRGR